MATPMAAAACQFTLGFATLSSQVPVGDCLENQAFAANGDALQHTTKGLMVWRKADNWTAFTDGSMTWVNFGEGIKSRPNAQRFRFEADYCAVMGRAEGFSPAQEAKIRQAMVRVAAKAPQRLTLDWFDSDISDAIRRRYGTLWDGAISELGKASYIDGLNNYADEVVAGPAVSVTTLKYPVVIKSIRINTLS